MRTITKTKQPESQPSGLIIDPSLDAHFNGKVLFPNKVAKLRKFHQNGIDKTKGESNL
jgi:hypothetical protein